MAELLDVFAAISIVVLIVFAFLLEDGVHGLHEVHVPTMRIASFLHSLWMTAPLLPVLRVAIGSWLAGVASLFRCVYRT